MASNLIVTLLLVSLTVLDASRTSEIKKLKQGLGLDNEGEEQGREGKKGKKKTSGSSPLCKPHCSTHRGLSFEDFDVQAHCDRDRYHRADECQNCKGHGHLPYPDRDFALSLTPNCAPQENQEIPEEEVETVISEEAAAAGGGAEAGSVPEGVCDHVAIAAGTVYTEESSCNLGSGSIYIECFHGDPRSWCSQPFVTPGHKYKTPGQAPLCCRDSRKPLPEQGPLAQTPTEKDAETEEMLKAIKTPIDSDEEPKEDEKLVTVPDCEGLSEEGRFEPEEAGGKQLCRDTQTEILVNNVCCNEAIVQLLQVKAKADAICEAIVSGSNCKNDNFEKKRNKYKSMPEEYTCKKMYWCTAGKGNIGPVPHQALCKKEHTGLSGNLPAVGTCRAFRK